MTNRRCRELIEEKGVDRNPMSGIQGMYYTTEREKDLRELIQEIIQERRKQKDEQAYQGEWRDQGNR